MSYSASYIGYAFGTRSTKPNSSWSRLASPSCSSSRMPSWMRSSSSMFHSSSPAKQKNSSPTHAFSGSGTIHGLQERKFWIRPTFTFGSWM